MTGTVSRSRRAFRWIVRLAMLTLGATVVIVAAGAFGSAAPGSAGDDARGEAATIRELTTLRITPAEHESAIEVYAEARPRWTATLTVGVSGRIETISPRFFAGNRVSRGDVLATIRDEACRAALAGARRHLAEAELALTREEHEAGVAVEGWRRMRGPDAAVPPLVARRPQLEIARRAREEARVAVEHATETLAQTVIRAPFDGVILSRRIDPGETALTGEVVGELYASCAMEVDIHLGSREVALLPDDWRGARVALTNADGPGTWTGTLVRDRRTIDRSTRLRGLVAEVERPLDAVPPLLPGTLVRVRVAGRSLPRLLRVPDAAVTQDGRFASLESTGRLRFYPAVRRFTDRGHVYLSAPDVREAWEIVAVPLTTYATGMKARSRAERKR